MNSIRPLVMGEDDVLQTDEDRTEERRMMLHMIVS
jgi:hypothetical protein